MTSQLAPLPVAKFFDNNGAPLAFGLLTTYVAGTTTPQATYIDSTQTTQNNNPIQLNFRGECNLWLDPTKTYKFLLQDSQGNTIPGWPVDNIPGGFSPSGIITSLVPIPTNTLTLGISNFTWANAYFGPSNATVFDPVSGNIGYYARTAAEIAALVTPTNFSYAPLDARRYGADPTGVAASDAAFNNGVAVLAQVPGGTLRFPAGLYSFASANTALNSKSGMTIQGDGSASSGLQPGTRFQFTGTGTGTWFAMNGAQGVQFKGIQFVHTQAGFTGTYIQCNNNGVDPSGCGLYDCALGANVGLVLHLDLNKCINFSVYRCTFQYSGSSGSVRGAQVSGYANNISFKNCEWFNGSAAPIQNSGPHQAWSFINCDFEGLSQATNKPSGAILSIGSGATWAALIVQACWLGDCGTATGVWFDGYFDGAVFQGNYISGNTTGSTAFNLRQSVGVVITGNAFTSFLNGINFALSLCQNICVRGNINTGGITNPWVGTSNILIGTFDWGANFGFGVPSGHGAPINANGYRVYPDGTGSTAQGEIEQWGSSTVTVASGTITVSGATGLAFPNVCNNVTGNISASANSNGLYLTPSGVNFTYTITGVMPASVTFSWRAVGN